MKAKIWIFLGICFYALVAVLYLSNTFSEAAVTGAESSDKNTICETEHIPYEEESVESDEYDYGSETITTTGVDGEREVCTNSEGETVSDEVIKEPVTQVVTIGTYIEPEPVYYYNERSGAICNDGTYSYATGSGACSWHGGVSEWLY